eukprot:3423534-Rhodomonas_salina.1
MLRARDPPLAVDRDLPARSSVSARRDQMQSAVRLVLRVGRLRQNAFDSAAWGGSGPACA